MKRHLNFKSIGKVMSEIYFFISELISGEYSSIFFECVL